MFVVDKAVARASRNTNICGYGSRIALRLSGTTGVCETHARILAARMRPSYPSNPPSKTKRAQGMPGDGLTHGPPATKKAGGSHHRCRRSPAFPARWFTAYIAISPGTGLSCPRRLRDVNTIANLASASGGQDHATSPSAPATFVRRVLRVHRIPAPHIVTIGRNVPLHRGGMRESMVLICPTPQAKRPAADWHDGSSRMGCMRRPGA